LTNAIILFTERKLVAISGKRTIWFIAFTLPIHPWATFSNVISPTFHTYKGCTNLAILHTYI